MSLLTSILCTGDDFEAVATSMTNWMDRLIGVIMSSQYRMDGRATGQLWQDFAMEKCFYVPGYIVFLYDIRFVLGLSAPSRYFISSFFQNVFLQTRVSRFDAYFMAVMFSAPHLAQGSIKSTIVSLIVLNMALKLATTARTVRQEFVRKISSWSSALIVLRRALFPSM